MGETNIRLAIPIFHSDAVYTTAEIRKPTGKALADTRKASDSGDFFSALRVFLGGCIESFTTKEGQTVVDKVALKSLIPKLPYKSAEQLAISIVSLHNSDDDDGIEGVYYCPRCQHKVISQYLMSDGIEIDTRDFISQLTTGYYDGDTGMFTVDLSENVVIKNATNGEVLEEIESFEMRFPTLEHGISAYQRYGGNDDIRLQFAMFAQSLVSVNGVEIDSRWRNNFGMILFEGIKDTKVDLGKKIIQNINTFGVISTVRKNCPNCGKEWLAHISTSNFFVSALRVT